MNKPEWLTTIEFHCDDIVQALHDVLFWTSANSAPEAECYVTDLPEDARYYPIRREYKLFEFPDKDESRSTWVADVYVESASKQLLETFRLDDLCERNVVDLTVTDKDGRTLFQYECEHPNETSWGLEGYIPRISGPWWILPKERPPGSGVEKVHEAQADGLGKMIIDEISASGAAHPGKVLTVKNNSSRRSDGEEARKDTVFDSYITFIEFFSIGILWSLMAFTCILCVVLK